MENQIREVGGMRRDALKLKDRNRTYVLWKVWNALTKLLDNINAIEEDYNNWEDFKNHPRKYLQVAHHNPQKTGMTSFFEWKFYHA